MGKIKKILENELVGGTQGTDVYPVTSVKAVYDENNERLDNILSRRGVINMSTNYNNDHIAELLTLSQAIAKVPSNDRVLGFQGKYLTGTGWECCIFTGDSITQWLDETKWTKYVRGVDIAQVDGDSDRMVMSQKAVTEAINNVSIVYDSSKQGTVEYSTFQEALNSVPSKIKSYCKYIIFKEPYSNLYRKYRLISVVWSDNPIYWVEDIVHYTSELNNQKYIKELYIEQTVGDSFFEKEYKIQINAADTGPKLFRIYNENNEVLSEVFNYDSPIWELVEQNNSGIHGSVIISNTLHENILYSTHFYSTVTNKENSPTIYNNDIIEYKTNNLQVNEVLNTVHNLYNSNTASIDTALDANTGTTYSVNGWIASDYIAVKKGTTYYGYNLSTDGNFGKLCVYDSGKQFLKAISGVNTYSATEDGYVRFSCNQNDMKCMFLDGVSTEYIPFGKGKIFINSSLIADSSITAQQLSIMDTKRINLINPSLATFNKALLNGVPTEFSGYYLTDFIEIEANKKYYFGINGKSNNSYQAALFKKDYTLLSVINDLYPITTTENCYLRLSKSDTNIEKWQLQEGEEVTSFTSWDDVHSVIKDKYLPKVSSDSKLPYQNKKVLILGDSITHLDTSSYGWVKYFMEICKPSLKVNLAVDGATWRDKVANQVYDGNPQPSTEGNCIGNQVQKVLNEKEKGNSDYSNFDVIIIAAGTNDGGNGADGETIESVDTLFVANYDNGGVGSSHIPFSIVPLDSIDRQKFAGIMRYTYQKLSDAYPNAIFVITTPLQEVYESFASTYAKGELFKYIAKRLSINCFDTLECGICNLYESSISDIDYDNPSGEVSKVKRDLSDGIHTNESGARKLGYYIARKFSELFIE